MSTTKRCDFSMLLCRDSPGLTHYMAKKFAGSLFLVRFNIESVDSASASTIICGFTDSTRCLRVELGTLWSLLADDLSLCFNGKLETNVRLEFSDFKPDNTCLGYGYDTDVAPWFRPKIKFNLVEFILLQQYVTGIDWENIRMFSTDQ